MPEPVKSPEELFQPQTGRRVLPDLGDGSHRGAGDHAAAAGRGGRDAIRCGQPDVGVDTVCAWCRRALVHAAALAGDHAVGLGLTFDFSAGGQNHGTSSRRQGRLHLAQPRRAVERAA